MKMRKLKTRIVMYLAGLFIMTIGIAISVKSNLGGIASQLYPIHDDLRLEH